MLRANEQRIVVIGAGLMGVGLAQVFAVAGYHVSLVEADPARREQALPRLRDQLLWAAGQDLLTAADAGAALARVTSHHDTTQSTFTDEPPLMVLEAVSEDLALKQRLFGELDQALPATTLLCTNTSGLSVTAIASACSRPERVCGTHFWNPPHLIPVVEVVRGEETVAPTIERVVAVLQAAGKTPVICRDVPGFLGNRLLHALQREAMSLVSNGVASAADVDLVVTRGFGRRLGVVGPLAVCDLAGLDLVLDVDRYLLPDLESSLSPRRSSRSW